MKCACRSRLALLFRASAAQSAGSAFSLNEWVVAGAGACELAPFLRQDLDGDPCETEAQKPDTQEYGEHGGRHGAKILC